MGSRLPRQHTLGPGLLLSLAAGFASCAQTQALTGNLEGGLAGPGLSIRLAFGAAADLDLYVSDPLDETVYYANSPSASGGALEVDRRCIHQAPRIETIRFLAPPPGRYRVSVDYPHRCDGGRSPVPFAIRVDVGERTLRQEGTIEFLRLQPVVLEFDVSAEPEP